MQGGSEILGQKPSEMLPGWFVFSIHVDCIVEIMADGIYVRLTWNQIARYAVATSEGADCVFWEEIYMYDILF